MLAAMVTRRWWMFVLLFSGCADEEAATLSQPLVCAENELSQGGRCIDPSKRYEPAQRLDTDNVSAFGEPFQTIKLPDPPKSGFRIVVPPRVVQPGEEISTCVAWPMPKFKNTLVYSARMYATPGLHHSNVISKPIDAKLGANPYPKCHPGADDPFKDAPAILPDVLFGSSTQVTGVEHLTFPEGMAFRVDPAREIATNIHYLNTSDQPQRIEVAYDFFTATEAEITQELAPFAMQVNDFLIPAHSKKDVGSTCRSVGGNIVSLMPHTHSLRTSFTVDLLDKQGASREIYRAGKFDARSEIAVYNEPIPLDDVASIRFNCAFNNTHDIDVKYGIGKNEMCILFGYSYPLKKQFVSFADYEDKPCQTIQLGLFRDDVE